MRTRPGRGWEPACRPRSAPCPCESAAVAGARELAGGGRRCRRRPTWNPEQRSELAQGEVGAPVRGHQQAPVLQQQRPRPAPVDRIGSIAPQRDDQLAELPRAQPGERGYPGGFRCRDYTSHSEIISPVTSSYGTTSGGLPPGGSLTGPLLSSGGRRRGVRSGPLRPTRPCPWADGVPCPSGWRAP